jgi:hypothetical protein
VLREITQLVQERGWDAVHSYGSVTALRLKAKSSGQRLDAAIRTSTGDATTMTSATPAVNEAVDDMSITNQEQPVAQLKPRAADRPHDDVHDPVSIKAERGHRAKKEIGEGEDALQAVRGVESLGAWAGASMLSSLRIRGVQEVERDDFLKHGLRSTR